MIPARTITSTTDQELVVAGYDGSAASEAAVRAALREATLRRGRLLVVAAWHAPAYTFGSRAAPTVGARLGEQRRRELADRLASFVDELRLEAEDVPVEARVVEGEAVRRLLEAAAGAGLLVVGSRGLGRAGSLVLGSVSRSCERRAPCPVLVVAAG